MVYPRHHENCLSQSFIFHVLIGLGEGLTSTYFVFFMSKVKVTKVNFVKKCFPLIVLIIFYHRAFICNVLIGLSEDKTPIAFGFTRSKGKVTRVTFVKLCKHGFMLIILRTVCHKAFTFHMLIGSI